MSRSRRRPLTLALVVLAVAMGATALAWACTPAAYISLSPSSVQPGSAVTVTGDGFVPGPVEIRFAGTALATATGPSFAVEVTVPNVAPGVYYVQASSVDGIGRASRAITVAGASAPPPAAAELVPAQPQTATPPAAGAPAAAPDRGGATVPRVRQVGRSPARERRGGGSPRRERAGAGSSGRERQSAGLSGRGTDGLGLSAAVGFDPVAGRAASSTGRLRSVTRPRPSAARAPRGTAVSARSAASDLWGGFASADGSPSLSAPGARADGPGSGLAVGLALIALGLLCWAAGVATARRRSRVGVRRTG